MQCSPADPDTVAACCTEYLGDLLLSWGSEGSEGLSNLSVFRSKIGLGLLPFTGWLPPKAAIGPGLATFLGVAGLDGTGGGLGTASWRGMLPDLPRNALGLELLRCDDLNLLVGVTDRLGGPGFSTHSTRVSRRSKVRLLATLGLLLPWGGAAG
mmetsp:Transcript_16830/g.36952  ORF Transcript_16830/g.36952 Transcript_16830/m.36952 type:complete len:154 (-) Transcript_16830:1979-2440(-)